MSANNRALVPGIYLSDKNLAAILGVARPTVWAMLKRKELPPPVKLSIGTTRWKSDSVIEFLEKAAA